MKNKSLMKKVITGVLAGGMLLGATGLAYAQNTNNAAFTGKSKAHHQMDAKKVMDPAKAAEQMKTHFDKFITEGIISQDQENKILDFMKQKAADKKAEMDKIKSMTQEERKAYFAQNAKDKTKVNPLSELVTAGIISQDQADKMTKAAPARPEKKEFKKVQAPADKMKTEFDKLVTAGTISQDQENKIFDYLKQKEADRKAEMDKVKAMTQEERKTYFAQNIKNKTKVDLFTDLVNQGILTQDQVTAIKNALPQPKQHNNVKGKKPAASTTTTN